MCIYIYIYVYVFCMYMDICQYVCGCIHTLTHTHKTHLGIHSPVVDRAKLDVIVKA